MRQPRKTKIKPNPKRCVTVWMAYGADCANVETPTRSESHYLAQFRTTAQAREFAMNAYEMLITRNPEWQSLTVFVSETWTTPEGAPDFVADNFDGVTLADLVRS
jgi:hypothetical protein